MKKIPLTKKIEAIVDDDDYDFLSQFKWHSSNGYACRRELIVADGVPKQKCIFMHREIMNTPAGMVVDHINHKRHDNRKSNLRNVSTKENILNSKGAKLGKKGVECYQYSPYEEKWNAFIKYENKTIWLGRFKTEQEATKVYNEAARKYLGICAYQNEIGE